MLYLDVKPTLDLIALLGLTSDLVVALVFFVP